MAAGVDGDDFSCKLYEKRGRGFDFEELSTLALGGVDGSGGGGGADGGDGDGDGDGDGGGSGYWGHLRNVVYVSCLGRLTGPRVSG